MLEIIFSRDGAFVLAIVIPLASYVAAVNIVRLEDFLKKELRNAYSEQVITIPVAQAASDLTPLIRKLPLENGNLLIFGEDGSYITMPNGAAFRKALLKWTKRGLHVTYVILHPEEDVGAQIQQLMKDTEEASGSLDVFVLKSDTSLEELGLQEMHTRHPTLFTSRDGESAMWLEGVHQPKSKYAYNVQYVSPKVLRSSNKHREEFDRQRENVQLILDRCDPLQLREAA